MRVTDSEGSDWPLLTLAAPDEVRSRGRWRSRAAFREVVATVAMAAKRAVAEATRAVASWAEVEAATLEDHSVATKEGVTAAESMVATVVSEATLEECGNQGDGEGAA
eukprot:1761612-Prymnesium_polylepis.1